LGGDGWSVRVDYATEVAEGQTASAASAATVVYQIELGEGVTAGDVLDGIQATVSQLVTRLLSSDSFPPAATYAVSVSEGASRSTTTKSTNHCSANSSSNRSPAKPRRA
jgi:hypothetical protein